MLLLLPLYSGLMSTTAIFLNPLETEILLNMAFKAPLQLLFQTNKSEHNYWKFETNI